MIYGKSDNSDIIQGYLQKIINNEELPYTNMKELLERTHSLFVKCDGFYNLGLAVICHVAEMSLTDVLLKQLLYECIVESRIFLYGDMLGEAYFEGVYDSIINDFSRENYSVESTGTLLTKDQKDVYDLFFDNRRVVISAPTSFGKSRIVEEIIINNNYKNIVIVLPTIALLTETFYRLKNTFLISSKYNLINSLGRKENRFDDCNNIFILTPEKTEILLDNHQYLEFDFFVMDEIYKIQDREDFRARVFTNCLYRLTKYMNIDYYLIGPYFKGFSRNFLDKNSAIFKKYTSEIVQKNFYDLSAIKSGDFFFIGDKKIRKLSSIKRNLKNILKNITGLSIVYRGSQKYHTEVTAKYIANQFDEIPESDLTRYIKENISTEWSLVSCLSHGVAFHHSALPKYIQTEIINAFNDGCINVIVCTSTIIEGVNTSAKNVILYDNLKGDKPLSGFDVKNIKGRAGRFMKHFIGDIYALADLTKEEEKDVIEFDYFDNKYLEPEEYIQVDKEDLTDLNLNNRNRLEKKLDDLNIPLLLIKSNKYIPIDNQLRLISYLRSNGANFYNIGFSESLPNKSQLSAILRLCHEYLFLERDLNDRIFTVNQWVGLTNYYVYKRPSTKDLINNRMITSSQIDTRIRNAFHLISNYFEFKLPKYLFVFENIYNFVSKEVRDGQPISLKHLITILEYGYSEPHEICMKEAGLPSDIIKKIGYRFEGCFFIEEIRNKFKVIKNDLNELSNFEISIMERYL
jgi:ERCC4-related helicase